jgi:hypothetical protein
MAETKAIKGMMNMSLIRRVQSIQEDGTHLFFN